jgi:hypothetical protein
MTLGSGNDGTRLGSAFNDKSGIEDALDRVALVSATAQQQVQTDLNLGIQAAMQGDANLLAGRNALGGAAVAADAKAGEEEKEKSKRDFDDRLYQALLDRSRALEREMAAAGDELRQRYGEDFIGGMSARFLPEEQLATLHTDDQRLEALSHVILDENGRIKAEYEGTPEARYVRAWKERQQVDADVRNYPHMNAEQREEVAQRLESTSSVRLFRADGLAESAELDQVAERTTDARAERHDVERPASALVFGSTPS